MRCDVLKKLVSGLVANFRNLFWPFLINFIFYFKFENIECFQKVCRILYRCFFAVFSWKSYRRNDTSNSFCGASWTLFNSLSYGQEKYLKKYFIRYIFKSQIFTYLQELWALTILCVVSGLCSGYIDCAIQGPNFLFLRFSP